MRLTAEEAEAIDGMSDAEVQAWVLEHQDQGQRYGGYGPSQPVNEERWARGFAEKFNNAPRDAYGARMGMSPAEVQR